MHGLLVFIIGFSTLWIMIRLHARVAELERCVNAVCQDLDDLQFEIVKKEFDGKK